MSKGMNGHAIPPKLLDLLKQRIASAEETQLTTEEFIAFLEEKPIRKVLYYSMAMDDDQPKSKPAGIPGTLGEFYTPPEKPSWAMRGE